MTIAVFTQAIMPNGIASRKLWMLLLPRLPSFRLWWDQKDGFVVEAGDQRVVLGMGLVEARARIMDTWSIPKPQTPSVARGSRGFTPQTMAALTDEWQMTGQIAAILGVSTATATQRLKKLCLDGKADRSEVARLARGRKQAQWRRSVRNEVPSSQGRACALTSTRNEQAHGAEHVPQQRVHQDPKLAGQSMCPDREGPQ